MQEKHITEWLKSLEGITSALCSIGSAFFAFYVAIEVKLEPVVALFATLLPVLIVLWFGVRSYRRFAKASRLEQPDRFALSARTPKSLIGRDDDLKQLLESVAKHRVVLLDGESGCGKSALVVAGVAPSLLPGAGLLPVYIGDWGNEWVRGPLATALGALFEALTPAQRATLGWAGSPDLAADAPTLAAELGKRLDGVAEQIGRRPLLIADQFDDYQARHRQCFIDANGGWVKPDALASVNPFWALIRAQLRAGKLHLLVVTRADTASGLSCVRFLDSAMTADRHLPRVEVAFLHELLVQIAPEDATPRVVSQPEQGWYELRDRVEGDLKLQGAVLMQQVRTVLLGLRQLPYLNTTSYRRAGGLNGTKSLVVARAIRRAGDAANGSEANRSAVRRMLRALVLPIEASQDAKAQRASFADLAQLVGDDAMARKMLQALQEEDLVRPAEGPDGSSAWQLDHDYLANAVLEEARQADRWSVALRDGWEQFRMAGEAWQRRWTALLPIKLQVRLAWERLRGRLRYGEAAGYARLSLLKPVLGALLFGIFLAMTYLWEEDRALSLAATRIYERFGSANEAAAVLEAWQAPKATRDRLFRLVQEDPGRLERATRSAWPQAHGGLEAGTLLQSAILLREGLGRESNERAKAYATVVAKLSEPSAIEQEAAALREHLVRKTDACEESKLVEAYAGMVAKLADPSAIAQAVAVLRECLACEGRFSRFGVSVYDWGRAYKTMVDKLDGQSAIAREAAALRERFERETDLRITYLFAKAYVMVAAKAAEPAAIVQATAPLREHLTRAPIFMPSRLAQAYATVELEPTDLSAITQASAVLHEFIVRESDSSIAFDVAQVYAKAVTKLTDPPTITQAAAVLRERLVRETDPDTASRFAEAYATVAAELTDPSAITKEAAALRERLLRKTGSNTTSSLAQAFAIVAAKLTDPMVIAQDVAMLRESLLRETDPDTTSKFAEAYATVAAELTDPSAITKEAATLRKRLLRETDSIIVRALAQAYATVAAELTDPSDIAKEAASLRERLLRETSRHIVPELVHAYGIVAAKLTDPMTVAQDVAMLRELLGHETRPLSAPYLVHAYTRVVAKLTGPSAITKEVIVLRERLVRETDSVITSSYAEVYAALAAKLTDQSVITREATVLREHLVHETRSDKTDGISKAYAVLVKKIVSDAVSRADRPTVATQVGQILTMAGHPFLGNANSLLSAMEPASGNDFGSDVGAAVKWWVKELRGDPATLRPKLAGAR